MQEDTQWLLKEARRRARRRARSIRIGAFVCVIVACAVASLWLAFGWQRDALQLAGLVLNFFAAVFLVVGALPSEETAVRMSRTEYDGNPDLLASVFINRKVAQIGIGFIALGFVLQGIALAPSLPVCLGG